MSCGHEVIAPDTAPVLSETSGGSATRYLSNTGILVAGLLIGLMLFTSESSDQPSLAVAPLVEAKTLSDGQFLEMLRSGKVPAALRDCDLMHELIQTIDSVSPGNTANSSIYVSFWLNSNANTKREIILLINELEDQNLPGLVDVAYPFLGLILVGGGELDEQFIWRMLSSMAWMGEDLGMRQVTGFVGQYVLANTPIQFSPAIREKITSKL